jgi:ParB family chromosome partitioning protein
MSAITIAADVQDTAAVEATDTDPGTLPEPVGEPGTDQQDTATETAPAAEPDPGYLVHLDPTTLVLEDNIRTDDDLDDAFVESVRDNGVLLPVRAYLAADDARVTVRDGRRRVLAAIKVERPTVPVYVTDPGGAVERIIQQYEANERRAAMTNTDRIGAWQQLQLAGLSVTAIARATHEKRQVVRDGLKVATSTTAAQAVTEHDLALDQAAVLIEFEDDPKTVKRLLDTARHNPDGFAHEAQRIRDQRTTDQQIVDLTAQYTERGIQVIAWPSWGDTETVRLADLTEADGTDLDPETFATRPGYRVAVRESYNGIEVGHFVTDWKKHGLKKRRSGGTAATWTEQQKRERRDLIANNKAWPSAEVVRREWLTALLARKTTPKDALLFVATVAAQHPDRLATALSTHQEMAATLLGGTYEWGKKHPLAVLIEANPAKATTALLAVTLGALEQATSKNTWRNPASADVTYFTVIKCWGYVLSDVENLVLGIKPEPEGTEPGNSQPDEPDEPLDDDDPESEGEDEETEDDDTAE